MALKLVRGLLILRVLSGKFPSPAISQSSFPCQLPLVQQDLLN